MRAIINANIVLKDGVLEDHALIYDDKILDIPKEIPQDFKGDIIDAKGLYLIPGLIDQHIHGYMGYDAMDADEEGLKGMAKALLENGVTGFLPTTVTLDNESIAKSLDSIKSVMQSDYEGARILGAHLEGPYLSSKKKGAHEEKYLKNPEKDFVEKYADLIKIVTLAPECSTDFIPWCTKKGIQVSLGHSAVSYDEACEAFDMGASQVTHLFNGMSGIHHQNPGVAGAGLLYPNVKAELIADTIHVRRELFPMIYRTRGADGMLLITDCMRAGGMPPGEYKLGNLDVVTDETSARLKDSGSLAGSVVRLNRAVKLFEKYAGAPKHEVVAMASYNPACQLGLQDEIGSIEKGKRANLALVDADMNVKKTIVDGKVLYEN